jgi:acyl homoserine lactone synthase
MFTTIQHHEIAENSGLMDAVFRLRKRVFHDQLGWSVPVCGDQERDVYDNAGATYLVWCSDDKKTLYGTLRLIATSRPTLLHDVFFATHGRNPALIDAGVWEGTRMCIDDAMIARDYPDLPAGGGFNLLFVALCEAALALGITRIVSNFEASMARIYRRAGLAFDLHGRADGYGAKTVHCASFAVNAGVKASLHQRHGLLGNLFVPSAAFRPLSVQPHSADARLELA